MGLATIKIINFLEIKIAAYGGSYKPLFAGLITHWCILVGTPMIYQAKKNSKNKNTIERAKVNKMKIAYLFVLSFSAQAVNLAGSDEWKGNYMNFYVEYADLIVKGKVSIQNYKEYIKVDQVIKGNPQYLGQTLLIFNSAITWRCTHNSPEYSGSQPCSKSYTVLMKFPLSNEKGTPYFLEFYSKPKTVLKIQKLIETPKKVLNKPLK